MDLPKLQNLDVTSKRVLLRLDLDTDPDPNDLRIKASEETLNYLKEHSAEIIVIGHKGRPTGDRERDISSLERRDLSLKPFQPIFDRWGARVHENLRFESGEERNDADYAKQLATLGDVYVNEAFGSSHRNHASIVGLPKLLPHAIGLRFEEEIENLSRAFEKPVIVLISGIKEDKVEMAKKLAEIFDLVLVGGSLPEYFGDAALESVRSQNGNLIIGNLAMDKEDITLNTVQRFKKEIESAGTIILAGVLGKYEDAGHMQGTREVFNAVANSSAFKIAGGGDTEKAISQLAISDKFDWISVGGGAMIEFLINKTLPGIEAMK